MMEAVLRLMPPHQLLSAPPSRSTWSSMACNVHEGHHRLGGMAGGARPQEKAEKGHVEQRSSSKGQLSRTAAAHMAQRAVPCGAVRGWHSLW